MAPVLKGLSFLMLLTRLLSPSVLSCSSACQTLRTCVRGGVKGRSSGFTYLRQVKWGVRQTQLNLQYCNIFMFLTIGVVDNM